MATTKYQDYLAANVLNEGRIISYRLLSRALKVHINTAKEMLYEFHQSQNARKPDSVHASYLIYGSSKPRLQPQSNGIKSYEDSDTVMQDNSFPFSSSLPENYSQDTPPVPIATFTLATQERLQEAKNSYDKIYSIHIYSLEPGPLSNIYVLSDCTSAVATSTSQEDPLESWKQYGTIRNPNIKRRDNRPSALSGSTSKPTTAGMKQPVQSKPQTSAITNTSTHESQTKATTTTTQQKARGDIFSSFAKGNQKSAATKPTESKEDVPMKDAPLESDAEEAGSEPEDLSNLNDAATKEKSEATRRAKAKREAELQKMMEDDSEPESHNLVQPHVADDAAESPSLDNDSPSAQEDAEHVSHAADASPSQQEQDAQSDSQAQVTVADGRRRGRRRVMKRKTTKDAEGFLVTKEEPVWESFSEDEVEPNSKGKSSHSSGSGSAPSKPKKNTSSAKPGQGNIMSFFGKK